MTGKDFSLFSGTLKSLGGKFPSGRDGAFWRRRRGGLPVQHGKRGVLQEAAEDLPGSPAAHRGLRDVLWRDDVLRDAQTAAEDGGDGAEVPAAPGVPVSAAPR